MKRRQSALGSANSWLTQEGRSVLQAALQAHRWILVLICILLQRLADTCFIIGLPAACRLMHRLDQGIRYTVAGSY